MMGGDGEESCSICGQPPDPGKDDDNVRTLLLRKQLEAFFLVNTLLQVPSDKCAGFLSSYGNPGEWMTSLCQGCLTKVEEAYELNEKIRELRKRIDSIGKDLALPLRVKREAIIGDSKDRRCVDEIRDYVCNHGASTPTAEPQSGSVVVDNEVDDEEILGLINIDNGDEFEDPFWELRPSSSSQQSQSDEEADKTEEVLGEKLDSVSPSPRVPMTIEQIRALSGSQLREALCLTQGSPYTTCPISGCGRLFKNAHTFQCHVTTCHPSFLLHLRKAPLPQDHECVEGVCLPSLLLDPASFQRGKVRARLRPPSPVPESLLSKDQILSMNADQLTQALFKEGKYFCPFCPPRTYPNEHRWKTHFRRVHPKFLLHLKKNPKKKKHECEEGSCLPRKRMILPDPDGPVDVNWVDIVASKSAEANLPLPKSRKKGNELSSLAQRLKVTSFPCTKCPQVLASYAEWGAHQKQAHWEGFPCSICCQNFITPASLENHTRTQHSQKNWFLCFGCGAYHWMFQGFNAHLRKVGVDPRCLSGAISCTKCRGSKKNRQFESQESLALHLRVQHETDYGKPYHCSLCEATFSQKSGLKYHTQIHTHKDGFVCPQCGKSFNTSFNLNVHTRVMHAPPDEQVCRFCEKVFPHKSSLQKHLKLHAVGKPHLCPVCGKGFKIKNYLTIHSWSHDPEKRGKYAEYSQRLKNNEKRVRRGRRERVEEVQVPMDVENNLAFNSFC